MPKKFEISKKVHTFVSHDGLEYLFELTCKRANEAKTLDELKSVCNNHPIFKNSKILRDIFNERVIFFHGCLN